MSISSHSKSLQQKFDNSWKSIFVKYFHAEDGYVVDTWNASNYKIFTVKPNKNKYIALIDALNALINCL